MNKEAGGFREEDRSAVFPRHRQKPFAFSLFGDLTVLDLRQRRIEMLGLEDIQPEPIDVFVPGKPQSLAVDHNVFFDVRQK